MPISIDEFWRLTTASGLLAVWDCQALNAEFAGLKGSSGQANAASLVEWLVAKGTLSRYQGSVLLAGRPGPFVFGEFVIVERIESGRLARTFRAVHRGTQRVLVMFASTDADRIDWGGSADERVEEVKSVKSPHVSRTHQLVRNYSPPFFVLEDLHGQSLREHLAAQRPAWHETCRIGFQAALGLVAIHERYRAHGNVCPENLWIDPSSTVKLLQFPLAGEARGAERLRQPAVDYLSPELHNTGYAPSAASDIYSLGCVLFELIAGRAAFPGGTLQDSVARHRGEVPQRVDQLVPKVSDVVADLVADMMAKDALLRPQTASHVAHVLAPYAGGKSPPRTANPPSNQPQKIAPGYGAWQAPGWQAPPQQAASTRSPADKPLAPAPPRSAAPPAKAIGRPLAAVAAPAPPAAKPAAPLQAGRAAEFDAPLIVVDAQAGEPSVTSPAGAALIKRRRANTTLIGVVAGLTVIGLLVVAGLVLSDTSNDVKNQKPKPVEQAAEPPTSATQEPATQPEATSAAPPESGKSPRTAGAEQAVDDDGQSLWASPTAGKPLSLRYAPSGSQLILALRPADILAQAEGSKLVAALGPAGKHAIARVQTDLGVELSGVQRLAIALFPDDAGLPQAAYTAELVHAATEPTLLEKWGKPPAAEHASKKFYQADRFAYYLPPEGQAQTLVVAPAAAMKEILERDGDPTLGRGIEKLLHASDGDRYFTLLAAPGYLLADGKHLLVGDLARLRDPLVQLLDGNLQAVLASAHLDGNLFLELRALGPVDMKPQELAGTLETRLKRATEQLERYVAALHPQPYGRLVIHRFPRMVQLANGFTRWAVEDQQAVLRCYLPENAAHNLVLGAELTLAEEPGATPSAGTVPVSGPRRAADALAMTISLSVPRDSLERALELLGKEIDTRIVILGADLQLEGITKNQQLELDEHNRPAGDVLRRVLGLANPDGKLVWVIKPGDDGREEIWITTRAAAEKRGDRLPADPAAKTPAGS